MLKIKEGFKGERLISLPLFAIEKFKKDELGKELYLTNIGYFPNAEYHYCRREAANSADYILIYCVKGEGWLEYNGKKIKLQKISSLSFHKACPMLTEAAKGSRGLSTGYTSTVKKPGISVKVSISLKICRITHNRDSKTK